jgi:DNA modification methylase
LENGRNPFYCENAAEIFLEEDSVDLFIGHPPYFMAELEGNGGDPKKQIQNAETLETYWNRMLLSFKHMEHALKPDGNIFIALPNVDAGLGIISVVENNTNLKLHSIRMWDFSEEFDGIGHTQVIFTHFRKNYWDYTGTPPGPFLLKNRWDESQEEIAGYEDYVTAGTAPKRLYNEFITNYSKPGDVVCDLFAGSGTVCLVAMELGRKFIYNDVSDDRVIMAKKRIDDAYERLFGQEELRS